LGALPTAMLRHMSPNRKDSDDRNLVPYGHIDLLVRMTYSVVGEHPRRGTSPTGRGTLLLRELLMQQLLPTVGHPIKFKA
jgi:hypothetical protein